MRRREAEMKERKNGERKNRSKAIINKEGHGIKLKIREREIRGTETNWSYRVSMIQMILVCI